MCVSCTAGSVDGHVMLIPQSAAGHESLLPAAHYQAVCTVLLTLPFKLSVVIIDSAHRSGRCACALRGLISDIDVRLLTSKLQFAVAGITCHQYTRNVNDLCSFIPI